MTQPGLGGTQPGYSKERPTLLLGTRVTWSLKDKEDKTQLVMDLSMVSESVDLDLVLFAFFRKVHPCLLPRAYFSFGATDIQEHCDAGKVVAAFLCLQLKMLCKAKPGQPSHYLVTQKTAGAVIIFARKTGFFFKILTPCLASWQQTAVPGGTLGWRGSAQSLGPHHKAHKCW